MVSLLIDFAEKSAHRIVIEESICIADIRGLSAVGIFPPVSQFNGFLFWKTMVNVF